MPRILAVSDCYLTLVVCACLLMGMITVHWKIEEKSVPLYPPPQADTSKSITAMYPPPLVATPSPEAEEVRMLKELIKWPEHRGNLILDFSTSPRNCEYNILHPKAKYTVGETLKVFLTARDHQKRPKTFGGDFFRAKLHSPRLKAGVTGYVHDHQNGTYTIHFLLAWPGKVAISIRLIHSSEAVQIIRMARDSRPDKVYFNGLFQWYGMSETTECNLEILNVPVCEYQDKRNGERWVCVRPKYLPCDTLVYHATGGLRKITDKTEDALLARKLTDQTLPVQTPSVYVFPKNSNTSLTTRDILPQQSRSPLHSTL